MNLSFGSCSLLLLTLTSGSWALSFRRGSDELVDCLKSSLSPSGSVLTPGDPLFLNDTTRVSSYDAPSFKVVSQVTNEDDVRASIECATTANIPFLFTGPKHGFYTGFEKLQGGLEIYTAAMDQIIVNADDNTMTVAGAGRFQDVIDSLYAVGKNIPVGSGPCVGHVGASLGAGIGRLEGLYGLLIDSILSLYFMLPNTTVVEVTKDKNPDLFWGIRGAGFNFGYVLNATYRVYDEVPNGQNLNADFEFPYTVAKDFYQALKDEAPKMPPPLCIATSLQWSPTYNKVWQTRSPGVGAVPLAPKIDRVMPQTTLFVNAVYAGPESEGREAVKFLEGITPVLRKNYTEVPWNQLTQNAFFLQGDDSILNCAATYGERSVFGAVINQVDVDASVQMTEQFNYLVTKYPQMRGSDNSMYFCARQAVEAVPEDSDAYAWRGALGHQTWGYVFADNSSLSDASIEYLPEKMRSTIADTAGTDGLAVYVGFSNGDEPIESVFGKEKLPRLAALKKRYDPDGLFNAYHPLPTSYPSRSSE